MHVETDRKRPEKVGGQPALAKRGKRKRRTAVLLGICLNGGLVRVGVMQQGLVVFFTRACGSLDCHHRSILLIIEK